MRKTFDLGQVQDLRSLSDGYSPTSTYGVGDYCTRGNRLYKCVTAVTNPEEWDGGKWQETTVCEEIKRSSGSVFPAHILPLEGVTYVNGISSLSYEKLNEIAKHISNNPYITDTITEVYYDNGNDHYKLSIGDSIDITFGDEVQETLIMCFNHCELTSFMAYGSGTATGKAGILLQTKNSMNTPRGLGNNSTNNNYWKSCEVRTTYFETLKSSLPQSLQSVLKSSQRKISSGNLSTVIETCSDVLFLPTEMEVFGNNYYSADGESGPQFAYYKAGNSRIKSAGTYEYKRWYTSSPVVKNGNEYAYKSYVWIQQSGNADYSSPSSWGGIAPCFCI